MFNFAAFLGNIRENFTNKLPSNSLNLKQFLAKALAGTLSVRVLNIGLAYVLSILLARILGVDGYGSYIYALALINFLQIPTMLGMTSLITREVAVYQTQKQWGLARGIIRWASINIGLLSSIVAIVAAFSVWQFQGQFKVDNIAVILVGLAALPLINLSKIRESQLHALGHIVKAQVPTVIIRPVILVVLFCVGYFFFKDRLNPTNAIALYVLATSICLIIINIVTNRVAPKQLKTADLEYRSKFWLTEALPMLLIGSMYLINNQTDTLMLGVLNDSASVGIYSITNRGASLMNLILSVFSVSIAPTLASLHAAGDKAKLQKVVKKSANLIFLSSLPIALGLILFGKWFLFIFGREFVRGQAVLTILCIGKLINASTGSVALLLNMTGYQKYTFIGVAISAVLNVILNALFIPQWGAVGAATATGISTLVWNVILVVFVRQKLKINMNPWNFKS